MGQTLHENQSRSIKLIFTISFFLNTHPSKAKNKISTNYTLFPYHMIDAVVGGGKKRERGLMGKKREGVRAVYFFEFFVLIFQKSIFVGK